ncbi:glycosyltransferase [bacterium]|nr:glycosyltransferase [bacterium]MDC1222017.1 glycosyltransferase [Salibacteraceae bacterium]
MESGKKIKVLRIINRFNIGGPTYNAAYLTKYLDDQFETLLVGGAKDDSEASSEYILQQLNLKPTIVKDMQRSIGFSDLSAYNQISLIIKDYQPDIVHTHASKSGFLGRLAAHNNNVPIIIHTFHGHVFHSYFGSLKTTFYKGLERWLGKKSTKIIAISNEQKRELVLDHKICESSKMEVIPLGFDLTRFSEESDSKRFDFRSTYGLQEKDVAIVIVGRLVPIKNHDFFIKAINKVINLGRENVRFFIVGDGESRNQIELLLENYKIGYTQNTAPNSLNPVCLTSWIKNVDWVYAGSDIVCLTSLNEGTPVSLIEAQAASRPIVSTRVGGIEDIVLEDRSAYLCDKSDGQSFANFLIKLIDNQELRISMGKAGKENAFEKFNYSRLVSDISHLYSTLMKNIEI